MNWMLVKNYAKWLWITAILVFIVHYAITQKGMLLQAFSTLSVNIIITASLLIFAAKLCLIVNMRQAAKRFSINLNWFESYCIYNLTQLGKYIPGSIWQFVGRIAILRERGVPAQDIRDSLLAEHLWIFASASIMASFLIFSTNPDFLLPWLPNAEVKFHLTHLLPALIVLAAIIIIVALFKRNFIFWLFALKPPVTAVPVLILTWLFLGASLWVILEPFTAEKPSLVFIVGLYCLAYVAGFLVPFAPAGLGIREAILILGLLPFVPAGEAIILAAISRVIYFLVEIIASAFCILGKVTFNPSKCK